MAGGSLTIDDIDQATSRTILSEGLLQPRYTTEVLEIAKAMLLERNGSVGDVRNSSAARFNAIRKANDVKHVPIRNTDSTFDADHSRNSFCKTPSNGFLDVDEHTVETRNRSQATIRMSVLNRASARRSEAPERGTRIRRCLMEGTSSRGPSLDAVNWGLISIALGRNLAARS